MKISAMNYFNSHKRLVKGMVLNDIKKEYIGSSFGLVWAFIQPLSVILVLWFVFEVGFKSKPINDVPFILWLSSGLLPWFFFANALEQTASSIISQSYLIKKISFPSVLLPFIKIYSGLVLHLFMMFILAFVFLLYGISLDIYWLQLIYYMFASSVFLMGIGWILASFVIFIQDVKNLVTILIQFGFWGTPIFWALSLVPEKYHFYLMLNPFAFLIQGYRDCMIDKVWFWERGMANLYFWIPTLVLLVFGFKIFNRLKPHFVDVL
ncbi:ABC transporter permease [Sulfurimonas sp. MAG313]|nr:ABC transporter permease [Sulfurimonas sp. MAG313]MDF1881751.1 ABC transporter permease [Sulfurimonas sp. MAG313]